MYKKYTYSFEILRHANAAPSTETCSNLHCQPQAEIFDYSALNEAQKTYLSDK